jgi:uncharacterized protein (TIGR02996 family)
MSDTVSVLLHALRGDPGDETAWLALADGLEEAGQPDRASLTRLARRLRHLPDGPDRSETERSVQKLLREGVRPCVPEWTSALGMKFVLIPAGTFRMGSPDDEAERLRDEGPAHEVEITQPFYLSVTHVTQEQYKKVMGTNPSRFWSRGAGRDKVVGHKTKSFPVDGVSWDDAATFCQKLPEGGYRLPTEAEWEYACRAGTRTPYHFGLFADAREANFDGNFPTGEARKGAYLQRTCTVGSYPPNAFGVHDMHGNLWEWCSDWFDEGYYRSSPRQDPAGPEQGASHVLRGGSWDSYGRRCRGAARRGDDPSLLVVGFRVLLPASLCPQTARAD